MSAFLLIVLFRCRVWEQTHVTVSWCRSSQTLTRFNLAHHKCRTVSFLSEAGGGRVTFHGGRIPLFALTFARLRPCVCVCVSAWFCVEGMYCACGFFAAQKWNQRSPRDGTILSLFTRPWSLQFKQSCFCRWVCFICATAVTFAIIAEITAILWFQLSLHSPSLQYDVTCKFKQKRFSIAVLLRIPFSIIWTSTTAHEIK